MTTRLRYYVGAASLAAALASLAQPALAAGRAAEQILGETCAACHAKEGDEQFSRISHQRKTPEGWLMSIARMQVMHGVQIDDADRRTLAGEEERTGTPHA